MTRQFWTVGFTVLSCCLVLLAASWLTPGAAQQPPAQALIQGNWRYQVHAWGTSGYIILLDSQTGRCWMKGLASDWVDLKSPPAQEKK